MKCRKTYFFIPFIKFVSSWSITRIFRAHVERETVIYKLIKEKITLQFSTFFYYQTISLSTHTSTTKILVYLNF